MQPLSEDTGPPARSGQLQTCALPTSAQGQAALLVPQQTPAARRLTSTASAEQYLHGSHT